MRQLIMKRGSEVLNETPELNLDNGQVNSPEQIAARPKLRAKSLRNKVAVGGGLATAGWAGTALALSTTPITAPLVLGTVGIAGVQVGGLMLAGYAGYKTITGVGRFGYNAVSGATKMVGNYFSKPATEQPLPEQAAEVLANNDNAMAVEAEQTPEQQEVAEEVAEVLANNGMETQVEQVIVEQPNKRRKLVEETETEETTYQANLKGVNEQIKALRLELKNCKTLFNAFDNEAKKFQDAQFENGTLAAEQPGRNKLQFLRWELKKLGELSETGNILQPKLKKEIASKIKQKISKPSKKLKI